MIRSELSRQLDHDPNFRWRGEAVTRIENLSDIVFALALGMLVSASSPPETYQQLMPHLVNIVPVIMGFGMMLVIWNGHFTFFRRYGVADRYIVFLNAALLLLILFIAYPLRFAFDSLFAFVLTMFGEHERMARLGIQSYGQAGDIIAWLHVGLAVSYFLIGRMYVHAYKKRELIELSPSEMTITRRSIWHFHVQLVIAVIVALLAAFTIIGPFAGFLSMMNWLTVRIVNRAIPLPAVDTPVDEGGQVT